MKQKILLIGVSTGGPSQIKEILSSLNSLTYTIIIVQHMKEEVLPFFIEDLRESTPLCVLETPLTLSLSSPSVIVCSHSSILDKKHNNFSLITNTTAQNYTPDINKLFDSFVPYTNEFDIHVLIMTGIGRDGIDATKKLKERGAFVVAQDEETSPVFGMPKAAIEEGIVDEIKSLSQIKQYMREL